MTIPIVGISNEYLLSRHDQLKSIFLRYQIVMLHFSFNFTHSIHFNNDILIMIFFRKISLIYLEGNRYCYFFY